MLAGGCLADHAEGSSCFSRVGGAHGVAIHGGHRDRRLVALRVQVGGEDEATCLGQGNPHGGQRAKRCHHACLRLGNG